MLIREVKNLRHSNPEMLPLGLTPPTPQPQDAGFKTNFISSIYGMRGSLKRKQYLKVSLIISPLDKEKAGGLKSQNQGSQVRRTLAWTSGGFGNPEF